MNDFSDMNAFSDEEIAEIEALDFTTLCDVEYEVDQWNWHPALPGEKPEWWERGVYDVRKRPYCDPVRKIAYKRCGQFALLQYAHVVRKKDMSVQDFFIWWHFGPEFPEWYPREKTAADSPSTIHTN